MLDLFLVLPILVGVCAVGLALRQTVELSLRAPVAARPLAALFEAGTGLSQSRTLAERLAPSWAARLLHAAVDAQQTGDDAAFAIAEATDSAGVLAERHLDAIRALGRIAIPLALGSAIIELGLGFASGEGGTIAVDAAQGALAAALRTMATGFTTTVFCQVSVASLRRQAQARMDELRIVAAALTSHMSRTTR